MNKKAGKYFYRISETSNDIERIVVHKWTADFVWFFEGEIERMEPRDGSFHIWHPKRAEACVFITVRANSRIRQLSEALEVEKATLRKYKRKN